MHPQKKRKQLIVYLIEEKMEKCHLSRHLQPTFGCVQFQLCNGVFRGGEEATITVTSFLWLLCCLVCFSFDFGLFMILDHLLLFYVINTKFLDLHYAKRYNDKLIMTTTLILHNQLTNFSSTLNYLSHCCSSPQLQDLWQVILFSRTNVSSTRVSSLQLALLWFQATGNTQRLSSLRPNQQRIGISQT